MGDDMEVNVLNLKHKIEQLRKNVNDYDNIHMNIYDTLKCSSNYWNDNIAHKFYTSVEEKRLKIENNIEELNAIIQVYQYIIDQYKKIGSKISIDLQNRDYIIGKFDNYINKLNNLITYFRNIDISFCPNQAYYLNNEKARLIKVRDRAIVAKNDVKNIFNSVRTTEQNVNLKLSKIDVEILKDIDLTDYV